jgi:WD40 repeat protein
VPNRRSLALAVFLTLVAAWQSPSQPPRETSPRKDFLGDPLPPGAVARVGSTRLRHGGTVGHLSFAPGGRGLVSLADDNRLCVWGDDGKQLRSFERPGLAFQFQAAMHPEMLMHRQVVFHNGMVMHAGPVTAVAASADGRWLAAVEADDGGTPAQVVLLDTVAGKEARRLTTAAPGPHALGLSADGKLLAFADQEAELGVVHVCEAQSGKLLRKLQVGKQVQAGRLVFSPDGSALAGTLGNQVLVWNLATGKRARTYQSHEQPVTALAFSADGKRLATAAADGTVRVWEDGSEDELGKIVLSEQPGLGVLALAFSPDGKRLATGGMDRRLQIWDTATFKELRKLPDQGGAVHAVAFSADGATLAAGDANGGISLWDPATGKQRRGGGDAGRVLSVAFAGNGRAVLFQGEDGGVWQADLATGKKVSRFPGPNPDAGASTVTLAPDQKIVAVTRADLGDATKCELRLHDLATKKQRFELKGHEGPVLHALFSPDGRTLATTGLDQSLRLWRVDTGQPAGRIDLPGNEQRLQLKGQRWMMAVNGAFQVAGFNSRSDGNQQSSGLAFSGDGRTLAVVSGDEIRLWETATARQRGRIPLGTANPSTLAFAPRGRLLATAGGDEVIRLWDTHTGKLVRGIFAPHGEVHSLAFTPDGRRLASGGDDGTARVWDVARGEGLGQFAGHRGAVLALAFAADGKRLVSGGADTTLLVWDLAELGRNKTADAPRPSRDMEALWAGLLNQDAAAAYQVVGELEQRPEEAVAFLRKKLTAAAAPDPVRIDRLIADLDSPRFPAREKAAQALRELGPQAADRLRKALADNPPAESAKRLHDLLQKVEQGAVSSAEEVRAGRAVEALERVGTAEARRLLETLARGAPGARLTRDARAALERLARADAGAAPP